MPRWRSRPGIAYATTPGPNNVYSACMLKGFGTIRLHRQVAAVDEPHVPLHGQGDRDLLERGWTAGRPGAAGAEGRAGPAGCRRGQRGTGVRRDADIRCRIAHLGQTTVVEHDLDPGAYVFSARITATAPVPSLLACYLESGSSLLDQAQEAFAPLAGTPIPATATVTLVGAATLTDASRVFVGCSGVLTVSTPQGEVTAQGALTAVKGGNESTDQTSQALGRTRAAQLFTRRTRWKSWRGDGVRVGPVCSLRPHTPDEPLGASSPIMLPEAVNTDAIDASLETGVLKVTVPKSKPSRRRIIELK